MTIQSHINPNTIACNWHAISFSPEKRAVSAVAELDQYIAEYAEYVTRLAGEPGVSDNFSPDDEASEYRSRCIKLHQAAWAAKGRTMSPMITGPANFPVARNQKRMATEIKRLDDITDHAKNARKAAKRRAFPNGANGDPIRSNDPRAIEKLQIKLAELEKIQAFMKAVNPIIRKAAKSGTTQESDQWQGYVAAMQLVSEKCTIEFCKQSLEKDYSGRVGFPSYALTNNNAKIKATLSRIQAMEKVKVRGNKETLFNGFAVVENAEISRVQILFSEKPCAETRKTLKAHGFRWAPSQSAWQRQLTNNALYSTNLLIKEIAQ